VSHVPFPIPTSVHVQSSNDRHKLICPRRRDEHAEYLSKQSIGLDRIPSATVSPFLAGRSNI
jgi:hypothetical protein